MSSGYVESLSESPANQRMKLTGAERRKREEKKREEKKGRGHILDMSTVLSASPFPRSFSALAPFPRCSAPSVPGWGVESLPGGARRAEPLTLAGRGVLMAATIPERYEQEARRLDARLPCGQRVAVLGSTDFWHADSERTCVEIGRLLAGIPGLTLLTGGVEGIGEAIGRNFFQARRDAGQEPRVYHVLPEGEPAWDYGETFFAGTDMTERREVLGRLSALFVMVEGGPRAGHEAEVAAAHGAVVIPVGRSGGYAATLYGRVSRPPAIDLSTWEAIGASESTPEKTAKAVLCAVQACLGMTG